MARYIRVGATSARCPALSPNGGVADWENAVQSYIAKELAALAPQHPDLILFPELCDWPANMNMENYLARVREKENFTASYAAESAARLGCWLACPTVRCAETGKLRNACLLFDHHGRLAAVYDKTFLTQGELDLGLEPGPGAVTVDCELGRLGFAICFDLNYLELAGEYRRRGTELILFPALFHGGLLRQMWAFTAQAALLAASGDCGAAVLDPLGVVRNCSTPQNPYLTADINLDFSLLHLDFNAEKLERLRAVYGNRVRLCDAGEQGRVLLYSEDPKISAKQLEKEFELESCEDYLTRMARRNRDGGFVKARTEL